MGMTGGEFFSGTGLVEFVIAITLVEGVLLSLWNLRTGRGIPVRDVWAMLVPGIWLMLALRSAMAAEGWLITALYLLAAGFSHASDVLRRQRHYADKSNFD
jgi:hypothetical protein